MQDAMGYIGIENFYSVVMLLLYSSCSTASLMTTVMVNTYTAQ